MTTGRRLLALRSCGKASLQLALRVGEGAEGVELRAEGRMEGFREEEARALEEGGGNGWCMCLRTMRLPSPVGACFLAAISWLSASVW